MWPKPCATCREQATVEGRLAVYFYDTLAGEIKIEQDTIKARSMPHVMQMALDASNVSPGYHYLVTIC